MVEVLPLALVLMLGMAVTAPGAGQEGSGEESVDRGSEAPVNTLRWVTASEVDSFGFDIYRGTSPDGPFERITDEPIPGAGTTDEPTSYRYVDSEIDPTRAYYYYIESISIQGVRERFSPIQMAPPKRPVPEASEDGQAAGSETGPEVGAEVEAGAGAGEPADRDGNEPGQPSGPGPDPEANGDARHVSDPGNPPGRSDSSGMLR
jgi:hypothetical protein